MLFLFICQAPRYFSFYSSSFSFSYFVKSMVKLKRLTFLSKCLHNLFMFEEKIHQNNKSLLISTHLRTPNVGEFLSLIVFLFLVAGYLICTYFFFVSRAYNELQKELKNIKSLMIPSYMIELRKLLDKYSIFELNFSS
jgi:hypothetical protein